MVGEVEQAQADVAREEHERLCERASKGTGASGVTRLRVKVRDALHDRMAAELRAQQGVAAE